jgi:hypothetical protein
MMKLVVAVVMLTTKLPVPAIGSGVAQSSEPVPRTPAEAEEHSARREKRAALKLKVLIVFIRAVDRVDDRVGVVGAERLERIAASARRTEGGLCMLGVFTVPGGRNCREIHALLHAREWIVLR